MTRWRILLLDLDDVLLFSLGYRSSLRSAVGYFGRRLGYPDVPLSDNDIDVFEALGLTAEWDSATVCVCLLLTQVWQRFPGYTVGEDVEWTRPPEHHLPLPAFATFVSALGSSGPGRMELLGAAEEALNRSSPSLTTDQKSVLHVLLHGTRLFERSPIHRIIQEFNLGSRRYAEIYAAKPRLAVEGTLLRCDRPRLDEAQRQRLLRWAGQPGQRAVVFTNRPSTPPDGAFDTPEAELGMQATGLTGLSVVGGGGMSWISHRRNLRSGDLLKPSPVHALAAMRMALGDPLKDALETSAELALDGILDHRWRQLDGAEMHVFEDSPKGLRSANAAGEILHSHGISLEITLCGISNRQPKREALADAGASLFQDVQAALARVKGLEGFDP